MSRRIVAERLTPEAFAPFGDVIRLRAAPDRIINGGLCGRHHDLARLDILEGRAGISLFDAAPRALPYRLDLMERHPLGSQAFLPMSLTSFLVTVAEDEGGAPGRPRAFLTAPGEGVNIGRGVWHGVLTPLEAPGLFAVVDRIGEGANLMEARIDPAWEIVGG
ncbi:MAG: ureidoglycolate lyase [Pikeienuella sp.]|uniref:ureidoglycolate lyase n=1 Tax=Pikeienuella sp. TaxID=2831957 RepID=UPI00391D12A5